MYIFRCFALGCLLTTTFFSWTGVSLAETYRCEDPSGITVLTDSLAQLEKCTLLLEDSLSFQESSQGLQKNITSSIDGSDETTTTMPTDSQNRAEQDGRKRSEFSKNVTVPVKAYGGALVVTVKLNDQREAELILDTGATMTVLSTDVALDLGLMASTETQLTTVNTAGGPVQVNVSRLASLQTGAALAENVDVVIHDLPDGPAGIDGLLGMSFLNNFLVTLDTDKEQLHLSSR